MNASRILRFALLAGILAVSVSTAEAGKAKDARFVNPSKPEGKVKAVNRDSRPAQAAPRQSRSAAPKAQFSQPKNSNSSKGSNQWRSDSPKNYNNSYKSGKSGHYSQAHKSYGGYKKPRTVYKRYDPYCEPRTNVSISLGGGYYGHGSYVASRYYSSKNRCYYPSHRWGYGWGLGWGCAPWGWGSSYHCSPSPFYGSYSNVTIYNSVGSTCSSAGGTYYSDVYSEPYAANAYQAPAHSSVNDYRDWQQSVSGTRTGDSLVISTPESPGGTSAAHWTPSGRQAEAVWRGWALVAEGRAREAVALFALECESDSRYAQARVGYAVASALAGEGAAARWGMRRAWAIRGQNLAYLPSADGLTGALNNLSGSLWRDLAGRPTSADDWFLLASVDYLRHDLGSAARAAQEAANLGDDGPSLRNLIAQIRAESAQ